METIAGGTLELDLRSEEVVVVASEDGRPSKKLITLSSSNVVLSNDDLLIEILLRLPVLSVLLFRSVSKQWLSLITDASFTLRRRQIPNLDPPSGVFIRKPQSSFEYDYASLNSKLPSRRYPHKYSFSSRFGSGTKFQILQSCNGLLLCSTRVTCDEYYIYNPSTDLCKMLPSRHVLDLDFGYAVSKIKITFDPRRSTYYKVVSANIKRDPGMSARIQTYSPETGVWCVCDIRFPPLSFFGFENGICWNNAIHWLHGGKLHYKLDIADHPVLTNLQTLGFLDGKAHWDSKLRESRGCLLLVYMEFPDSLFDVYEMRNESSGWLLKYTVNLDDTLMQIPEEWSVSSGVCCIVLEDREEDSFMVINISGEVWQYKFMFKTHRKLCSLGSVGSSDSPEHDSTCGRGIERDLVMMEKECPEHDSTCGRGIERDLVMMEKEFVKLPSTVALPWLPDFKNVVIPSSVKMLKRNPELVLESIGVLFRHVNLDLSKYSAEILPVVLLHARHADEGRRVAALDIVIYLSQKASNPDAIESMVNAVKSIIGGSEGRLAF
ncbi:F-box protein-like protein isoform X1 [Tanacetum coccineum]